MNIPYTQLSSPAWQKFVESLNENYEIPSQKKLRDNIISYSKYITDSAICDMKNQIIGIAIDGASYRQKHYYAIIMLNASIVRLYNVVEVENQKAETIAKELYKCFIKCKKNDITIAGVVSDNAASLKCAIIGDHPLALPSLLGESVTRVVCSAHTVQLVVADVIKECKEFKSFVDSLLGLVSWISQREGTFKKKLSM